MMALRIMIVEDEMLLALDLEDMLHNAGYTVVGQASDMAQALALAESIGGAFDLAIMDVNLARGTSGVETAAALRRRWNVPCLFVIGYWEQRTHERALDWLPVGFVGQLLSERDVLYTLASITG